MFPSLSLTFITIPLLLAEYVFDALACHVAPPSKLYAASASPEPGFTLLSPLSSAPFIVSVTSLFVQLLGFPVTPDIVGDV